MDRSAKMNRKASNLRSISSPIIIIIVVASFAVSNISGQQLTQNTYGLSFSLPKAFSKFFHLCQPIQSKPLNSPLVKQSTLLTSHIVPVAQLVSNNTVNQTQLLKCELLASALLANATSDIANATADLSQTAKNSASTVEHARSALSNATKNLKISSNIATPQAANFNNTSVTTIINSIFKSDLPTYFISIIAAVMIIPLVLDMWWAHRRISKTGAGKEGGPPVGTHGLYRTLMTFGIILLVGTVIFYLLALTTLSI